MGRPVRRASYLSSRARARPAHTSNSSQAGGPRHWHLARSSILVLLGEPRSSRLAYQAERSSAGSQPCPPPSRSPSSTGKEARCALKLDAKDGERRVLPSRARLDTGSRRAVKASRAVLAPTESV